MSSIKKILFMMLISLFTLPVLAQNTILVVGDSLSAGFGIEPKEGWVTLLQDRLTEESYAYLVVNTSISGDTTSNGLARLPAALKKYQPVITIIELGANDGLRGISPTAIKHNLAKMIELAVEAGSKVLLIGIRLPPNYGPDYEKQFANIYLDLADNQSVVLVPLMLRGIDENKLNFQPDGLHPLAKVQGKILDNIWPSLQGLLKK